MAPVVVAHAAVTAALLSYQPVRDAVFAVAPIMVSLVTPPQVDVAPPPEPPKPKLVVKPQSRPVQKPADPPPVITAPAEAPRAAGQPAHRGAKAGLTRIGFVSDPSEGS